MSPVGAKAPKPLVETFGPFVRGKLPHVEGGPALTAHTLRTCHGCGQIGTAEDLAAHGIEDCTRRVAECEQAEAAAGGDRGEGKRMATETKARNDAPIEVDAEQAQRTVLQLAAVIEKVDLKSAKRQGDGSFSGGELQVTLTVKKPAQSPPLPKPAVDGYHSRWDEPSRPGDEPKFEEFWNDADPDYARGEDESKADYDKRKREAKRDFDGEHAEWAAATAEWEKFEAASNARDAAYERTLAVHAAQQQLLGQQTAYFITLSGLLSALAGIDSTVSITPNPESLEKFLPGFSPASLLASVGGGALLIGANDAGENE